MQSHAGAGNYPAAVQTDHAVEIEIAPTTWVPGTVVGRFDSRVAAEVEGRLTKVVEVGDRLQAGDVIAGIDRVRYELSLNEIEAELAPLQAELNFYERESERLDRLAEQNNAAKNRLEEIEMNRDQTMGKMRVVRAKLAMARDELSKTIIRAPFPGVVVERFMSKGERVDAGDQVIRLVDTEKLEVQARVPANSVFKFNPGEQILVKDGSREVLSTIRTVVPVGDELSRLYELRIENSMQEWTVGRAVKIAVPTDFPRKVVAVPRDALVIRSDGIRVYRVDKEGRSEMLKVLTGIANATHIEIKAGINAGDEIVVRGNERLRPGQQLMIQSLPDST
ncbi:MAG: efflux RND transporter periplasmic adaptor subunit [Thiotrichales bacterium]|nr:efflux RND transporter periplasmic adaptor subunit [Thiotrichales bacterium]